MQEDITQKTIALAIKTAKLDGQVLQAVFRKLLQTCHKKRYAIHKGKQALKPLMKPGTTVSSIGITDQNIKSFSCTAKKYGIDFSLKKDVTTQLPRYLIFCKGRDGGV